MIDLKNLDYLLPKTKALLLKLTDECPFLRDYVLVGGSALALHIAHRKSEDLDFFTYDDTFDKKEIFEYVKGFNDFVILNQNDDQVDMLLDGVKVTFFNAKWSFLKPEEVASFNVSSLTSIAAMKVNVLFLRAKYRDYYDIYCLVKNGMSLKTIFEKSLAVLSGITFKLFSVALVYIDDIEDDTIDHLEPAEVITKNEIRIFFENALREI